MKSSEIAMRLSRSGRARAVACVLLVALLGLSTSLISRLVPMHPPEGPSDLALTAGHFALWGAWITGLALVLSARHRLITRWPALPLTARAALEVALVAAFAVTLAGLTKFVVERTVGLPKIPEGAEPFLLLFLSMRGALLYGIGLLVVTAVRAQAQQVEREQVLRDKERLEAHLAQAQLQALRAQVRPHFLFNSLHAVGGLVMEGENPQAHRALMALSSLLRATMRHDDDSTVAIERELELIEEYLSLERIRLGDRLAVEIEVDPSTRAEQVPPLILLPIVENAILHGIAPRESGGRIRVTVERDRDDLLLTVLDDGLGYDPSTPSTEGSGIGLVNCRERLRSMHGDRGRLEIAAEPGGGTRVTLRFPARTASEVSV